MSLKGLCDRADELAGWLDEARAAAVDAMNRDGLAPQTEQERRAIQAELAYLRTFSEVYRQHLRIYTEDVLRTIEDWEDKERAAARDIPQASQQPPGIGWRNTS